MVHPVKVVVVAAVVVAAVVAAALAVCSLWPEPGPPSPTTMPRAIDEEPRTPAEATLPAARTTANTGIDAPASPTEPWLTHPFLVELEVLVVDELGLPIENEPVYVAPLRANLDLVGATGFDGRALLQWPARSRRVELVVSDPRGTLHRVTVQHGRRTAITFVARRSPHLVGDIVFTPAGQVVSTPSMRSAPLHPFARFVATSAVGTPSDPPATAESVALLGSPLTGDFFDRAALSLGGHATAPSASLTGTVFGEDGTPATNVPVALIGSSPQPLAWATTTSEGHFTFATTDLPANGSTAFTIRAGGDAAGLGTATIAGAATGPLRIDLRRDACLRGRVERADAAPHAPYLVAWVAEDGTWADETMTADDDTFLFANLPSGAGNVLLFFASGGWPIASLQHALPGATGVVLRHETANTHTIRVGPVSTEAPELRTGEIRVWQADSGLGKRMHLRGDAPWLVDNPAPGWYLRCDAPWLVDNLAPGWYQIELSVAGAGFVDLNHHRLDNASDLDLGPMASPRPGRVRFALPDEVLPAAKERRVFDLCELRADLDVRVRIDDRALDGGSSWLPAGTYAFAFRHRDGEVRFVRFTVRAGEENVVTAQ